MTNTDGGPAFPVPHTTDGNWTKDPLPQYSGMSLRDYIAVKAMGALLSNPSRLIKNAETAAIDAYRTADAMLSEREKKA